MQVAATPIAAEALGAGMGPTGCATARPLACGMEQGDTGTPVCAHTAQGQALVKVHCSILAAPTLRAFLLSAQPSLSTRHPELLALADFGAEIPNHTPGCYHSPSAPSRQEQV